MLARGRHEAQKRPARRMFRQGLCYGAGCERRAQHNLRWFFSLKPWKFPDALEILETLAIPCAPGSAHEIHSFPLISQRRICVSIRLRRLYPFRRRQDRESALRQASDADSTKIRGVRWGRSGWLEDLLNNTPVAASEEFVEGGNLIPHG